MKCHCLHSVLGRTPKAAPPRWLPRYGQRQYLMALYPPKGSFQRSPQTQRATPAAPSTPRQPAHLILSPALSPSERTFLRLRQTAERAGGVDMTNPVTQGLRALVKGRWANLLRTYEDPWNLDVLMRSWGPTFKDDLPSPRSGWSYTQCYYILARTILK